MLGSSQPGQFAATTRTVRKQSNRESQGSSCAGDRAGSSHAWDIPSPPKGNSATEEKEIQTHQAPARPRSGGPRLPWRPGPRPDPDAGPHSNPGPPLRGGGPHCASPLTWEGRRARRGRGGSARLSAYRAAEAGERPAGPAGTSFPRTPRSKACPHWLSAGTWPAQAQKGKPAPLGATWATPGRLQAGGAARNRRR